MTDNPVLAYGRWLAEAPADWPEAAWEAARRAFIDTLAVAVAGAAEPVTLKVLETVRPWSGPRLAGALGGSGGRRRRARARL